MDARVDRKRLVDWLNDKARDEEETARHAQAMGWSILTVEQHRDRARLLRSLVAQVQAGDPDAWEPPDLDAPKRKSGEHELEFGVLHVPEPTPEVVTRPVPKDPRREPDDD